MASLAHQRKGKYRIFNKDFPSGTNIEISHGEKTFTIKEGEIVELPEGMVNAFRNTEFEEPYYEGREMKTRMVPRYIIETIEPYDKRVGRKPQWMKDKEEKIERKRQELAELESGQPIPDVDTQIDDDETIEPSAIVETDSISLENATT